MKRFAISMFLAASCLVGAHAEAQRPVGMDVPLERFFRHAEFEQVTLSPDGSHIAVTVPVDNRTVLAVLRVADLQMVGHWEQGANYHIYGVYWLSPTRFIYRVARKTGAFDFQVGFADMYASDIDGRRHFNIPNGNYYQIIKRVEGEPDSVWVQRSREQAFLFKLDTSRGPRAGVRRESARAQAVAPLESGGFLLDHDDRLRYAVGITRDRRMRTLSRVGEDWQTVHEGHADEAVGQRTPLGFAADNERVYFQVSDRGEPLRVVLRDPMTGEETLVSRHETVEPFSFAWSSDRRHLLAISYEDGRRVYDIVAPEHPEASVLQALIRSFPDHDVVFGNRSEDGRLILFSVVSDVDPGSYYLFDRDTGSATFLLANRNWIDPELMSPMTPINYEARDGLTIHGYLTVPKGLEPRDLPMVVFVHGGPHGPRDVWGFNPAVQAMASRGYAVLQLNYRGSGGYGQAFMARGYRRWGTTMQDDLTDGVRWAIEEGIAHPDRICIYGGSYGGYAALMSATREPDLYQCTIGYVGVYSLPLMFRDGDIPRSRFGPSYLERVLPETPEEQRAQSPAYNLDRLRIPVMLVHGAMDERVPISQMNYLVRRMRAAGLAPEDTVVERREGHGFYDTQNNVNLYTRIFAFLDRHTALPGD